MNLDDFSLALLRTLFSIFSLDPEEDPLCSIFLFDYFALRSSQYEFLVKFHQESDVSEYVSLKNSIKIPQFIQNLQPFVFPLLWELRTALTYRSRVAGAFKHVLCLLILFVLFTP